MADDALDRLHVAETPELETLLDVDQLFAQVIFGPVLFRLLVNAAQRLDQLKDVPTTAELGMPEINYTMWHGLYVARGTPREIVAVLNEAMRKAVTDPEVVARFKQLGTVPYPDKELSPEAHAQLFAADLPRVAKLVEASGAKPSEAK